MMYFDLFLTFLKIGAFTFGGGYAMISLVIDQVTTKGWLTEAQILDIVAVSESTPGPIAVNMATFVGSRQGGILGSFLATLGVVLPSFVIILIIAALIRNFLKYESVKSVLGGIRPCVVGLILATGITMLIENLGGIGKFGDGISFDIPGIIIFAAVVSVSLIYKKLRGKKPSPIIMILLSAGMGMLLYPLLSPM